MPALKGPRGPIPYERDALGYPRFRVPDVRDAAWALGHLHATDRLLQVRLTVLLAQGRAMELFGDAPLFRLLDRVTRLFDFRGDVGLVVSRLDDETRAYLQSYCDGFNAAAARRSRQVVYRVLGLDPGPHTIESMVLLYRLVSFFGLTSMQQSGEGAILELVARGGHTDLVALLLGEDVAKLEHLSELTRVQVPNEMRVVLPHLGGSNAFAVAPSRSASGGALLMAEPHMEVGRFPPILYATHFDYPDGTYYQGAGIPGIPWLSFGRTPDVGWGVTYGHGDSIDTMIERCARGKYLAGDTWKPLRRRVEEVAIRGKTPERWTFWDNDYGTVVGDAEHGGDLPCVRWTGMREVWRDLNANLPAMRARDVVELALHHRSVRCISLNAVLVDARGNIAFVQTGQVDQRPEGWTGATPWPGWKVSVRPPRLLGEDERPSELNPREGFIATANERRDGPHGERWVTLAEPRYRRERITRMLTTLERATIEDLLRISYDETDLCAERLLPIWSRFLPPAAAELVRWATNQSAFARADHQRMLWLFHTLHGETLRILLARRLGGTNARRFVHELSLGVMFQDHVDRAFALERPELLDEKELADLLAHAWPAALDRQARKRGAGPVVVRFKNVIMRGAFPVALGFDSPALTMPGGPTSPFQMRKVRFLGEDLVFGPALHYAIDMSKPGGFYHVPGGASEERLGPGYAAGVDLWLEGTLIPLGDPEGVAPSIAPPKKRTRFERATAALTRRGQRAGKRATSPVSRVK